MSAEANGATLRCHAPDCKSRAFRGEEALDDTDALSGKAPNGRGYAVVNGEPWHYACWFRHVRAAQGSMA